MRRWVAPLWCAAIGTCCLTAQQAILDGLRVPSRDSAPAGIQTAKPNLTFEQRGDIFMARKMYREAVEVYQQGPSDSAVLANKIGIAYHQLTFLNQARKQYERAQKIDSHYSEAVNNLGTIYYAQKNYRKAITQYRRALRLTPNSASIHSNLGTAFFARKRYKEAFDEYQEALKLDPEVFEHRNSHGVLLQERSVDERAKFYFYMAKTYAKSGQTDRALQSIRKAIEWGFKERSKFAEDSDFREMQKIPEFQELMKLETRAL